MTITLEDVRVLLGIPVTGKTVAAPLQKRKVVYSMVSRLLGVPVAAAEAEIRSRSGLPISLRWLRDTFSKPKR